MRTIYLFAILSLLAMSTSGSLNAQCASPSGLNSSSVSQTSANFTWNAVSGANSYKVKVQDAGNNPVPFVFETNVTGTSYTMTGLTAGATYKFKVRTNCNSGHSNWSANHFFIAGGSDVECVNVTGLTVSGTSADGASFQWNPSAGGAFRIRVEDASGNPVDFAMTAISNTNAYTINGLNPSSNYKVKVRKICAPGVTTSWTPWVFFTTAGGEARINGLGKSLQPDSSDLLVFPNPATEVVNAELDLNDSEQLVSFQIFDLSGKIVLTERLNLDSTNIAIPVAELQSGVYLLHVETTEQILTTRIFIAE